MRSSPVGSRYGRGAAYSHSPCTQMIRPQRKPRSFNDMTISPQLPRPSKTPPASSGQEVSSRFRRRPSTVGCGRLGWPRRGLRLRGERPAEFQSLIVHVASRNDVPAIAEVNAGAQRLMANFWPGPLTLVLKKAAHCRNLRACNGRARHGCASRARSSCCASAYFAAPDGRLLRRLQIAADG